MLTFCCRLYRMKRQHHFAQWTHLHSAPLLTYQWIIWFPLLESTTAIGIILPVTYVFTTTECFCVTFEFILRCFGCDSEFFLMHTRLRSPISRALKRQRNNPWSLCCVHVRLINCLSCIFSIFRACFYIRISVVNIFCLSSLLFMGHVPELKIDWLIDCYRLHLRPAFIPRN